MDLLQGEARIFFDKATLSSNTLTFMLNFKDMTSVEHPHVRKVKCFAESRLKVPIRQLNSHGMKFTPVQKVSTRPMNHFSPTLAPQIRLKWCIGRGPVVNFIH